MSGAVERSPVVAALRELRRRLGREVWPPFPDEDYWLGQNGEDRIIWELLGHERILAGGRVLDIGAHDGWSLSNTARLLEAGWGGTLVEASPRPLAALIDRWSHRQDIAIIGGVVMPMLYDGDPRIVQWHDDAGAACHAGEAYLSTTEAANVEKWQGATKFRRARLAAIDVHDLSCACAARDGSQLSPPWDVVSIDVEGTSVSIFAALLQELRSLGQSNGRRDLMPRIVVVEHDGRLEDVAVYEERYGYRRVATNAENVIMVRG